MNGGKVIQGKVRLALVGAGAIAQAHLRAISEHPDVFDLVAVCEPNLSAAERVVSQFPNVATFGNVDEMLASGEVDAAVVATPHFLHFEQAAVIADAGVSVLVEKPAVTTTGEIRLLNEIGKKSGALIIAGQTRRHAPEVLLARARMANRQQFGELRSFDITSLQDLRPYGGTGSPHWLFDGELAGGGVSISLAIHQIDMLRFLTGADYTAAMATARYDPPFINGAESQVAAVLELSNGASGTLHADYLATKIPFSEAMILVGENGSVAQHAAWLGEYRGPISFASSNGTASERFEQQFEGWHSLEDERNGDEPVLDAFSGQLLRFAALLRGEIEPFSTLEENFNTISCIEAIVQSARTGLRVEVEKW